MKGGMFEVGDIAVYPAYGVAVVEHIERREVNGCSQSFYVLRILNNDVTIMVPTDNATKIGMRQLISEDELQKVYEVLRDFKSANLDTSETWNRRYRNYRQRIRSGSIMDVASVLRDLYLLSETKELSTGEKRILDAAKNLVVKEISFACHKDENAVWAEIEEVFKNGNKKKRKKS